jgi:hypothetical protein
MILQHLISLPLKILITRNLSGLLLAKSTYQPDIFLAEQADEIGKASVNLVT